MSDTLIYKNIKFYRYPDKNKFYFSSQSGVALHRLIWEEAHGAIPDGYEIHHRDYNPINNKLENLQMLSRSEHRRLHAIEKELKSFVCEVCMVSFKSKKAGSKFCSNNCKAQNRRNQGADFESRVCEICSTQFECNKYNKTTTCSRVCSGRKRSNTRKPYI